MAFPLYLQYYTNMDKRFPFSVQRSCLSSKVESHRHDFLEISYVSEGRGVEIINGAEFRLEPGSFTFLLPHQYHEIRPDPDSTLTLLHCGMSPNLFAGPSEDGQGMEGLLLAYPELPSNVLLNGEARTVADNLFRSIQEELDRDDPWKFVSIRCKLLELMISFDRARMASAATGSEATNPSKRSSNFWNVIRHIEHHFKEELTLSELSRLYHYNDSYLSVLFKQHTGQHFTDYLQDVRLRHACALLTATDLKIGDIAPETGFHSLSTFNRVFQRKKGSSPTGYRRKHSKL
ncbi:AraC family transcriptional regulator [Cohnella sp. GCM10027633]|uniref:helix-turn-helix transcriptional regulator n=1 Tax=unclassified Cohnella TaxID=2636738 RepID=UPI0036446D05